MEQWPFQMPPVETKPPPPVTIPEEWQKANEALQGIKQLKSGNTEKFSVKSEPVSTPEFTNNYDWQNPYTTYPGYPTYPQNFGFYGYSYNYMMNTNPMYMNHMLPQHQPVGPMPPTTLSPIKKENDSEPLDIKANIVSSLASQPPPPPPPSSTPPANHNEPAFFTNISSKQAPGSGGIKFHLSKKKNQNINFQKNQGTIQNRANNFQTYNNSSNQDSCGNMQQSILSEKLGSCEWPPSMRDYVKKCFEKCEDDLDKDQTEIILCEKLSRAHKDGTILTKDWNAEPLPRNLI